ncbi:hypothetical protein JRQ81_006523 [Phrynocephalus forsythii]|uniref:Spermatogenesis-associated protein 2 PUB-like domain-containing protein n=1 Tax=Phrynocephalus forsythii TaxID=171643 RepID=A0A9Q0XEV9_9SAUR|nr:hypothetical protein JRQ81_006523 [Phrynocephalus forsythii]
MMSGATLQEEYRRCMERGFRRGHAGVCTDPSLKERVWHSLLAEPELHSRLEGEDLLAVFAAALRGHLDLGEALRNLRKAFEVLELAAINLYFFPWRKEYATIKTFSGIYVHTLQGVLPEADITRSFGRLGYVQRDNLHLAISKLPPGPSLLCAACSFFAARVECEILGKLVEKLEPCLVSPEQLLQARRESDGTLEGCVTRLQRLVRWPRSRGEMGAEPVDGMDLYQESPEGQSPYRETSGAGMPFQHRLTPPEGTSGSGGSGGGSSSPRLTSRELHLWSPPQFLGHRSRLWAQGQDQPYSNGLPGPESPDLQTSFSFRSLRRELSRTSDTDSTAPLPEGRFLSPGVPYDSPDPQPHEANTQASPSTRGARSPQLSPMGARWAQGAGAAGTAAAHHELPCYHLHSCLCPGTLPASCCNTCRLLHGPGCEAAQQCRGNHRVEELHSEKQKRLWLKRTEVDRLLQEGGGAWQ